MHTLTLLAHVSGGFHSHGDGVTLIVLGAALGALCFYFRKTA